LDFLFSVQVQIPKNCLACGKFVEILEEKLDGAAFGLFRKRNAITVFFNSQEYHYFVLKTVIIKRNSAICLHLIEREYKAFFPFFPF
jgi:hypothetical protein